MVSLPSSSLPLEERKKLWHSTVRGFFCERPYVPRSPSSLPPLAWGDAAVLAKLDTGTANVSALSTRDNADCKARPQD